MSVSTFEPRQISVTDAASAHIRSQIAQSGHQFLRLGVKESGCNGYMYTLDYLDEPAENDRAFEVADSLSLYVSTDDLPMVSGTEVEDEGQVVGYGVGEADAPAWRAACLDAGPEGTAFELTALILRQQAVDHDAVAGL